MGFWKDAGTILLASAYVTGKAGVAAAKLSGRAVGSAGRFVADHKSEIAGATKGAVKVVGAAVKVVGDGVAAGAKAASNSLHQTGQNSAGTGKKALAHGAGYVADALGLVGTATGGIGHVAIKASPALGEVIGGGVSGVAEAVSGVVDAVSITDSDFEKLHQRLKLAGHSIRMQSEVRLASIALAQQERRKSDLLDLLVVGGVSLAAILKDPSKVPEDVERAFELAYPGLAAAGESFADVADRLRSDELVGFVSGVKGKLFEIELVDHLNNGHLPDGMHAELAASATQPGYDVLVKNSDGLVVDVLQAKATESVGYVQEALKRYPDIDVVTTDEVHAHLMALGVTENVSSAGISDLALQQHVEDAANAGDSINASDFVPSSIGLAVIALSAFMQKDISIEQKASEFGTRAGKAGASSALAKTALIATHTWWVALIAGVGSRWLAGYGGNKRERYEVLAKAVAILEKRSKMTSAIAIRA